MNKKQIHVQMETIPCGYISRSEACEVLTGLEEFGKIIFNFDKVPTVGQAFADEVFRVFHHKYPDIKLEVENMSEEVKFMVVRAQNEAEASK